MSSARTLLFFAAPDDPHVKAVAQHLPQDDVDVVIITPSEKTRMALQLQEGDAFCELRGQDWLPDPADVRSVYYRWGEELTAYHYADVFPYDSLNTFWRAVALHYADTYWLVANPSFTQSREKLYQLQVARQVGMSVPPTFVGTDGEALTAFVAAMAGRPLVVKPLTSQPLITEAPRPFFWQRPQYVAMGLPTTQVDAPTLLAHCQALACPVIVQAEIPKQYELRVTYVAGQVFACRIDSQIFPDTQTDWRHGDLIDQLPHKIVALPEEVTRQIHHLMARLGLQFGGLDLIVTPENDYYFLEVNLNAQWLWVEQHTGVSISKAIAEVLCEPPLRQKG